MKNFVRNLAVIAMACMVGLVAGCGSSEEEVAGGGPSTIVNGIASKGIIYPGSVKIFPVDAGAKTSTPLTTVQTDQEGKFTADLGQYKGAIVIEVSGQYKDEATSNTVTIDAANPLHSVVYDVTNVPAGKRCAVTPLTDLAYSLIADAPLTDANIEAANARVSEIFKLTDIIWTEPVRPEAEALSASGVTEDQRVYTIALATLSQMAKDANGSSPATFSQVKDVLGSFKSDLSKAPDAGLVPANTSAFTAALETVTAPTAPLGGFTGASTKLQNVSRSEIKLTLSSRTLSEGTLIGGIEGTIILPPGTSVRTESASKAVRGEKFDAPGSSLALAGFTAESRTVKFAVMYGAGFSGGDFATLTIDVQTGVSVTPSDFNLSDSSVIDTARNPLNITISAK